MSVSKKEWVVELYWGSREFKADDCTHCKVFEWVRIWETTLVRDGLKKGKRDAWGFAVAEMGKDTHMEPDTIENCVRYAMALGKSFATWQLRLKHVPSGDIVPVEIL